MFVSSAKIKNKKQKRLKAPAWGFRGGLDYYPFGMIEPGRSFTGYKDSAYRYAFNGKLLDNDIYGSKNSYDYGARFYDPRLGRFMSIDPLTKKFPMLTPYQFSSNTPIQAVDLDGKESSLSYQAFSAAGVTTATAQQDENYVNTAISSINAANIENICIDANYVAVGLMVTGATTCLLFSETGVGEVAGVNMFRAGVVMSTVTGAGAAIAQGAQGKTAQAGATAALTLIGTFGGSALLNSVKMTDEVVVGQLLTLSLEANLDLVQIAADKATEKTQTTGNTQGGGTTGNSKTNHDAYYGNTNFQNQNNTGDSQDYGTCTQAIDNITSATSNNTTESSKTTPAAPLGFVPEIQGTGDASTDENTDYPEE